MRGCLTLSRASMLAPASNSIAAIWGKGGSGMMSMVVVMVTVIVVVMTVMVVVMVSLIVIDRARSVIANEMISRSGLGPMRMRLIHPSTNPNALRHFCFCKKKKVMPLSLPLPY